MIQFLPAASGMVTSIIIIFWDLILPFFPFDLSTLQTPKPVSKSVLRPVLKPVDLLLPFFLCDLSTLSNQTIWYNYLVYAFTFIVQKLLWKFHIKDAVSWSDMMEVEIPLFFIP